MGISLRKFAENVYIHLLSGVILLSTAVIEIIRTIDDGEVATHHGVAVFAFLQIIKTLPHFVHGAEQLSRIQK